MATNMHEGLLTDEEIIDGEYIEYAGSPAFLAGTTLPSVGEVVLLGEGEALPPGYIRVPQECLEVTVDVDGTLRSLSLTTSPRWKWDTLQETKGRITELVGVAEDAWREVAKLIRKIERERLYEAEANPRTDAPYASMKEYYPDLIDELRLKYNKRTLQQFVAIEKVLVENLGITEAEVRLLGPSRATAIVEATHYEPHTGKVAREPDGLKLGSAQVYDAVEEILDLDLGVRQTEEYLGEARGVTRVTYHLEFGRWRGGDEGWRYGFARGDRTGIRVFEDKVLVGDTGVGLTLQQAESLVRRLGATSNLRELVKEE